MLPQANWRTLQRIGGAQPLDTMRAPPGKRANGGAIHGAIHGAIYGANHRAIHRAYTGAQCAAGRGPRGVADSGAAWRGPRRLDLALAQQEAARIERRGQV